MAHITWDTAYLADNYSIPMSTSADGALKTRPFIFTVSTALVVNDLIKLCPLGQFAPGFMLSALLIDIPDLDSGTSLVFQLGDSTAADRYMTTTLAGPIGQTAGRISSFGPSITYAVALTGPPAVPQTAAGVVVQSLPALYDTPDALTLKVQTAPGTGLTGVAIKGQIWYAQLGQTGLS